ncbi:component of gems protein 1-like isoform X2 [Contarinia nasturtii]|uniref:component of gems protein 1-like isoform X2 n=1 Tax=Contarinia nasturtii TaxID=265458 RepID=UPI0012D496F5|nr:component of gems protein 1-like isoform X2 [Contarinia nasturtii]
MLTQTSHILIMVLVAILLPSVFSYSIYGIKTNRRSSRANTNANNNPSFSADSQQQQRFDQSGYRSPSSPSSSYYSNYDSLYDSGPVADSYYVDDDSDANRPEREYFYGRPTYHGEYKPTRYYYARAPYYNYYNDHSESTNPLDDLHEEMIQEEHERQRNWPTGKTNWFQNTGQPKSLTTNNFMKNLMLYNNGVNVDEQQQQQPQQQPIDVANSYDDDDVVESPYFSDITNDQNEPYDYFDPLKFQSQQYNQFVDSTSNKPTYFNQNNRKETTSNYYKSNVNRKQNDYDDGWRRQNQKQEQSKHEDKEEKDLESLRKPSVKTLWNNGINDAEKHIMVNDANHFEANSKHDDSYNGGYDNGGFDYDDDEWINWDRKRSLPKKQNENLRPLKVLEFQLTKALQDQLSGKALKQTPTITVPPTTTTSSSSSSSITAHEHKGQKEEVLSRPATPLRHHFSDSVLEAITKTTNEMKQSNQDNSAKYDGNKDDAPKQLKKLAGKKHKRFVSSETSLEQQLNGLKRKIKA